MYKDTTLSTNLFMGNYVFKGIKKKKEKHVTLEARMAAISFCHQNIFMISFLWLTQDTVLAI